MPRPSRLTHTTIFWPPTAPKPLRNILPTATACLARGALIPRCPKTGKNSANKCSKAKKSPRLREPTFWNKFAQLYRTKILPEWFPRLRATTFAISTRLKPMSDRQLAEIIMTSPEKMSLNQMFRVARQYPEGSEEFNRTIDIALKHYPDDETANLNAAAAKINSGDYDAAKALLLKAGDSAEACNLHGIIATAEGNFEEAQEWFEKAGNLPEASKNTDLLK